MQKLWRRDYNFYVNKDQLQCSLLQEYSLWKGDFQSFKSTTHDIIEFNPVFLVIVASHIRPRAMIIASFTSMLRILVKDCDHRSQPDVWGNNDRKHRIKPLNKSPLNNHPYTQIICTPKSQFFISFSTWKTVSHWYKFIYLWIIHTHSLTWEIWCKSADISQGDYIRFWDYLSV